MATDWTLVSKVKGSKYREKVLRALEDVKTPTQIQKEVKIDKAHVTRALHDMMKLGLVECLTPDARKFKLFKRTPKGNGLLKDIQTAKL